VNAVYQIHYFGLLAERRGIPEESVSHAATTAAELYQMLDSEYRLGMQISDFRVAINDELVTWDHPLKDGDRVAFLPPMSGG
jgi:molybdopterin synthase sulfur carrier subunit